MIHRFNDPGSATRAFTAGGPTPGTPPAVSTALGGLFEGLGQFSTGLNARSQSRAEAAAERVQFRRDIRDRTREDTAFLSRVTAILAANGASADGADVFLTQASELARGRERLRQDSQQRRRSLLTAGSNAFRTSLFQGIGTVGTGLTRAARTFEAVERAGSGG